MRYFLFVFVVLFSAHHTYSILIFPIGARGYGMGNATVAMPDSWSVWGNAAGMSFLKNHSLSSYFGYRYGISGLQTTSLSYIHAGNKAHWGAGLYHFGDHIYQENKALSAISKKIRMVSLGLQIELYQLRISDIGQKSAFLVHFGGIIDVSKKIKIGAHVYNINQARIADFKQEQIPFIAKSGLQYQPVKQLLFVIEAEKYHQYNVLAKGGLEYIMHPCVTFRTGIIPALTSGHFGVGFTYKSYVVDYSAVTQPRLGWSHHLSLQWNITKKVIIEQN